MVKLVKVTKSHMVNHGCNNTYIMFKVSAEHQHKPFSIKQWHATTNESGVINYAHISLCLTSSLSPYICDWLDTIHALCLPWPISMLRAHYICLNSSISIYIYMYPTEYSRGDGDEFLIPVLLIKSHLKFRMTIQTFIRFVYA